MTKGKGNYTWIDLAREINTTDNIWWWLHGLLILVSIISALSLCLYLVWFA